MRKINSIFIVDDDPITVYGIKKILKSVVNCEEVLDFQNGKKAIDHLQALILEKKEFPDIIFLDINMPIMDGWEFLDEFIKFPIAKSVNINIVSSSIDQNDIDKTDSYKPGTHHRILFNSKPIRKEEITEITNAVTT
ncbi:response regulator [Arenibacter certesii]|uniref:Response regulator n=1 Tax=Arenibacter certesii TaxID=228955 RepID=A0A918IMQ5_9FLAO|nr:response regulator [Arenibacter certesii]GGW22916.1 response regulator [Arenibacter certesii]